jgi:diacylglycerol kinase family enzyme
MPENEAVLEAVRMPVLVVNVARLHDVGRLRRACEQVAAATGCRPPVVLATTPDDDGAAQSRHALEIGADLVIAAGGDGTVRACAEVLAGTPVPLAIIPAGSANLTANALGLPGRAEAALQIAFSGRERLIDVGVADGMAFAAMAGIGLDAAVVGATSGGLKHVGGWTAYAAAAAGQVLRRRTTFTVQLDGGERLIRRAHSVTVGNSGALPGGFLIMPTATVDDGLLDIVILAPASPFGWANVGYRVLTRSRRDDTKLERYRARAIEITAETELPRQVDGEVVAPGRSLTVSVRPAALRVRVPA